MNKLQLRKLISECIVETIRENPDLVDEGFLKNLFGDNPTSYDKFVKKHDAGVSIHNIKSGIEEKITSALKDAYKMGETAGMDRKQISKIFRSAITGIFNKSGKLEEKV